MNKLECKKKILLISETELQSDPRLLNQNAAFSSDYIIHTLGFGVFDNASKSYSIEKVLRKYQFHFTLVSLLRKSITVILFLYKKLIGIYRRKNFNSNFDFQYWRYINMYKLKAIKKEEYDIIWANDIGTLPMAAFLKYENTKIVFDAHEYFIEESDDLEWIKKNMDYRKYLFERYLPDIDKMVTVSETIANKFHKEFGILPSIIQNSKPFQPLVPSETKEKEIHMVHHGVALPGRNIERIFELMTFLDPRWILHLYLVETPYKELERFKKRYRNSRNIIFHEPVLTSKIITEISQFDVGIYLLEETGFNNASALPNKIFEFIQARLMIINTPLLEIASIVKKYSLGFLAEGYNYKKLAQEMNGLSTKDIMMFKANSSKAAQELCAEKEWEKMRTIVDELLS